MKQIDGRKPKWFLLIGAALFITAGFIIKVTSWFYNLPTWMDPSLTGVFLGLGICFMIMFPISVIFQNWRIFTLLEKVRAILFLILLTLFFLAGVLVLIQALANILHLS